MFAPTYLQEIGRYPLLTPTEEISCAIRVQQMISIEQQREAIAQKPQRCPT